MPSGAGGGGRKGAKVDHRKGGGSKHVSSIDDVKARNEGKETAYDKAQRERTDRRRGEDETRRPARPAAASKKDLPSSDEGSSSGEEQGGEESKFAPPKRPSGPLTEGVQNPNAVKRNEMKEGVEMTRRHREELDKAAAQRRYQELHKAGKTDEAKADLARLAEVKARREAQAKERSAKEAAEREAMEEQKRKQAERDGPSGALTKELKEAVAEEKDKDKDKGKSSAVAEQSDAKAEEKEAKKETKKEALTWEAQIASTKDLGKPSGKVTDGSIEACRAEEEDFM